MTLLITICTEKVTKDLEFCEHKNTSDIFYVVLEEMMIRIFILNDIYIVPNRLHVSSNKGILL